jgi:3-deoxy-D-manno-octulosonate 8-phosphate phosphatase (KDO 8-P phosphatase)
MGQVLKPAFEIPEAVRRRAARIKLVLFDVDGVLTDGRLILGDDGQEYKAFHSHDGHGIKMLQRSGVVAGVITGRSSRVVEHRVKNLGITHVFQGAEDKLPVYDQLLRRLDIYPEESAFVGDDVVDLPIMLKAGLAIAPTNAHALVKQHAHWTTPNGGGQGAAREACELILYAQGNYDRLMLPYLDTGVPRGRESA